MATSAALEDLIGLIAQREDHPPDEG
jgi:hypothetical protein